MFCALSCWLKWKKTKYFPRVEHRSPAIFTGGGHEFVSEIGLFRQLAGKDDDSDDRSMTMITIKDNDGDDFHDDDDVDDYETRMTSNLYVSPQEPNSLQQG